VGENDGGHARISVCIDASVNDHVQPHIIIGRDDLLNPVAALDARETVVAQVTRGQPLRDDTECHARG